jgi:transcription antitermination factor NusG
MEWIVARTKSRREKWAAENVSRQGCEFYLPLYEVPPPRNAKLREARAAVLFPSYLFVRIESQWKFLLSTFGIAGIIMAGEGPAPVPQLEIDKLMRRHDESGLIQLPDKFRYDQELRFRSGPFQSRIGLYKGLNSSGRNQVLLDFLGGKRMVIVDSELLEVA